MKQKVVKGFTLIELIVVMAIFMVVMVAAMSLMEPVTKKVMLADARESGSAQVNSIASYLQSELGSAEYLMVTNAIVRDGAGQVSKQSSELMVADYVERYYEGVLKKGADVDNPVYGKGKVHVLTIDNTRGGEIVKQTYEVSFAPGAAVGNRTEYNPHPINKAFYDNTSYVISLGGTMMNNQIVDSTNMTAFLNSVSASDTTFNIEATITRGTSNPKTYTFNTTATVPLVNIMERSGPVTGKYFVVKEPPAAPKVIVDLGVDTGIQSSTDVTKRTLGSTAQMSSIYCKPDANHPTSGPNSQYAFVYSYGSEMLTNF